MTFYMTDVQLQDVDVRWHAYLLIALIDHKALTALQMALLLNTMKYLSKTI
jgi:hypothetical protein